MGKKGKKDKKKEKGENEAEEIPAVDRQFYELTIADLTNKLTRLRAHNSKIEEQNEDYENQVKQMEEDKADIIAYLNRTLASKMEIISELEDKLTELHKVREEENAVSHQKLKEWENKFKAMHDQLTSEIKLLNGKLNSLEEFRIQRDELMAKFDEQEETLKETHRKHKEVFYEMEQKAIQDKDRLRKEVEKKLLELSNEFNRTREIRVAAHTQRLVRENIALTNEMDKMMRTQLRVQMEHDDRLQEQVELREKSALELIERKKLIKTCESQLIIINQLTHRYERIKVRNHDLVEIKKKFDLNLTEMLAARKESAELKLRVATLERRIKFIEQNRASLKIQAHQARHELEKVFAIVKTLRMTVKSAIGTQTYKISLRENLLLELLNILTTIDEPKLPRPVEITQPESLVYHLGSVGFVPKGAKIKGKFTRKRTVDKLEPIEVSDEKSSTTSPETPSSPLKRAGSDPIIDIDQGSSARGDTISDGDDHGEGDSDARDKSVSGDSKQPQRSVSKGDDGGSDEDDVGDAGEFVEDRGVSPDEYEL